MSVILVSVLTLIGLLLLLFTTVFFARHQKIAPKINLALLLISVIGGLSVYLAGYLPEKPTAAGCLSALFQALYSTGKMFVSESNYDTVTKNAATTSLFYQVLFWIVNFVAVLAIWMTAFMIFGKKFLAGLRRLFNFDDTYIIFGVNEKSLCFLQNLMAKDNTHKKGRHRCVILIDETADEKMKLIIDEIGGNYLNFPIFSGDDINRKALWSAGLRHSHFSPKHLWLFAFTEDDLANYHIISKTLAFAEKIEIPNTKLCGLYIFGDSEPLIRNLSAEAERLHYSFLYYSEAALAARMLFGKCPLYQRLHFDAKTGLPVGKSKITVIILGFGKTGQRVLHQALQTGQFNGCTFEAIVVDQNMDKLEAHFRSEMPALFSEERPECITLSLKKQDVRENEFYESLSEYTGSTGNGEKPLADMVVTCLGDDRLNFEIAEDVRQFFKRRLIRDFPVIAAHISDKRYINLGFSGTEKAEQAGGIYIFGNYDKMFSEAILIHAELDQLALAINSSFPKAKEWSKLSLHFQESNRAAAAFFDAFLYIIGLERVSDKNTVKRKISKEDFKKLLENNPKLKENLGRTEHLRWNAFHYTAGWVKKSIVQIITGYEKRADEVCKTHFCLVPWEELPSVGQAFLNKRKTNASEDRTELDFQQKDKNNIYNMFEILEHYNSVNPKNQQYIVRR